MQNPEIFSYTASGTIGAYRFVKFHTSDRVVIIASAGDDDVIGCTGSQGAADGERVDVIRSGFAEVICGGTVVRGRRLMSDASGGAVAHTGAETRTYQAVIAGGAAGALTVTGILTTDRLIGVTRFDLDATAANIDVDDLTSEFSITAADTIDNTAGTATTSDKLLVIYERSGGGNTPCARAEVSGVSADRILVKLA